MIIIPNWCSNNIIVQGKGKVVKQFIQENFKTNKYPYKDNSNEYAYILDFEQFCPTPLDEKGEVFEDWYNWRLKNWGCKWSPSYEQCIQLSIDYNGESKIVYGEHENEDNELFNESFVNSIPDDEAEMKLEISCYCETPWGPPDAMFMKWAEKYGPLGLEATMKFYEPGCEVLGDMWFSGEDYSENVINPYNRKEYIQYLLTEGWESRDFYLDDCLEMIQEMHETKQEVELLCNKVSEILKDCNTEQAATLIADIFDKYYKWLHEPKEDDEHEPSKE